MKKKIWEDNFADFAFFCKKTKLNSIFNLQKDWVPKIDYRKFFQNPWQIMSFNILEK